MHFVVFGVLAGAGFLLAKALRSPTTKGRFLDMFQFRGEDEPATAYVIALSKDASDEEKAQAEKIKAAFPGAVIVQAEEKDVSRIAAKLKADAAKALPKAPPDPDPLPATENKGVTMAVDPADLRGGSTLAADKAAAKAAAGGK